MSIIVHTWSLQPNISAARIDPRLALSQVKEIVDARGAR